MARIRSRILVGAALAAFLAANACVETPAVVAAKPDEEGNYSAKAIALVGGSVPELALDLYNKYLDRYPDASAAVLSKYTERQKALFERYKNAGDVPHLVSVFANLRALGAGDDAGATIVKGLTQNELMRGGGAATLLAMQYADPSFQSGVTRSQMSPLTEFEKISCHILVHWTRKTGNGIVRTDYPYFTGSGFFIDSKHVVTAYHVIEPVFDDSTVSWGIEIKKDGAYHAMEKLVAYDSIDDIAVIETKDSFSVPSNIIGLFGDARSLKPGSDIYCLGDPQGFESTWTKGIVSAVSRRAPEIGTWMQIDETTLLLLQCYLQRR